MHPVVTHDYAEYLKLTGNETAAASLTLAAALRDHETPVPAPVPAPAPNGMLSLKQAAAYLGHTTSRLREFVEATRRSNREQDANNPTIQHFQASNHGAIYFRREWLDEFIERYRVGTPVHVHVPVRRTRRSMATNQRATDRRLDQRAADWGQLAAR